MYAIMDMGTSNTRVRLMDGTTIVAEKKGAFGAKFGKINGRSALFDALKELIGQLLRQASASEQDVECIMTCGMAGSEIGLCDVPHLALPADAYTLADSLTAKELSDITSIPFVFVPGLKACNHGQMTDIMRGEETEIIGLLPMLPKNGAVVILPGTHNKVVVIDELARVVDFHTMMTGELLDTMIHHSILSGCVDHDFELSDVYALKGAEYTRENGMNAALFHIRVMSKNGVEHDKLCSFLYGCVIQDEVAMIRRMAGNRPVYIGGRKTFRDLYQLLLGDQNTVAIEQAEHATADGLATLYSLYKARKQYPEIMQAIDRERLIVILRHPEEDTLMDAMQALYDGGVRLAEVTFDRSGRIPKQQTADTIRRLRQAFEGRMYIGAGTVTEVQDVMLAYEAGAQFIISPNCDPEVIRLTRALGLVSIPAAFTPTEIALALSCGADYMKLFPADQLTSSYVKAVKAPLSDAKLLAVGGVTADNAGEFIAGGFCGVGVGSNLYDKKLIQARDFEALTALARRYVDAVHVR